MRTLSHPSAGQFPSFRECFLFPMGTAEARRDIFVGGTLLLLVTPVGWILNLGHRLEVIHRLFHDDSPYFRGFRPYGHTFRRGLSAFMAIALYLSPAVVMGTVGLLSQHTILRYGAFVLATTLFVLAIYILPGGMTYNAAFRDISYLYRPDKAFRRAIDGGRAYLFAWLIAFSAILFSFAGLLGFGIGFFYTSVWAWSVVGYAFSKALSLRLRS